MTTAHNNHFHKRLVAARNKAGLSLIDVVFEIRQTLPEPMWISSATLHRLEHNTPEAKADPFLVNVLATIYGVPTSTISETAANHLLTLRDLLEHASPCITARPDRMTSAATR